ncbi:MAG: methyltransferase domain-containing protein [Patescibacteria group bacterium]|nr:methyltransferase domain-containing protein [bacterium]MDZ4227126.1 methyltransferase domain-containing protein [Patescibacteria group bacterium]
MQHTAQNNTPSQTGSALGTSPAGKGFAHPPRNVDALAIDPGMSIADFGSGSGVYVLLIANALKGYGHVYAVDIQSDLLRRTVNEASRKGYANVSAIHADLEKPKASKISDEALDLVLISNLLFQLEDASAVIKEARRILRSSGRLAIIDWSDSPGAAVGRVGPQKKDIVTKESALEMARKTGFELQREFPAGEHHYGLILKVTPKAKI